MTTPTGEPTPDFGRSVAVADDIVLIGAAAAHDSGRAYAVRDSDGWTEPTRLMASDPRDGAAVALSDTTALVGSPGVDAAYLFDL